MKYLAAIASAGLVTAGSYMPAWQAYVAIGFLASVLGLLFARAEQGSTHQVIESATEHPLELGELFDKLGANNLMPMYVALGGGHTPVEGAFIARLNGQKSIVLEVS